MAKYFDEARWRKELGSPTWYFFAIEKYKELVEKSTKGEIDREKLKEEIYDFLEKELEEGNVHIGKAGNSQDDERETIDTVVIHHTKSPPGITEERLNAMHLLRIYAGYYANPHYENEEDFKGKPIYSGHFREDRQVFHAYHWLVRANGRSDRLLQDDEIGWHAGNWEINKKSVAICFDDDLTQKAPARTALLEAVRIVKGYPYIHKILGHREVNPKTECPGNRFLDGWKAEIFEILKS